MAVIRPEKVAKIAELKELIANSKCTVLVDFRGLTVAQDTELRRKMREAGVHYNVVKNTLLRIGESENAPDVALVENGSWAPIAGKVMRKELENSKNLTFAENTVKIFSAMNDKNLAEMDALVEELCK